MSSDLVREIRFAARGLLRAPLFTATAALSLAIAIGANATVFGIVNGLLLRKRPGLVEPERLVDVGRGGNAPFDTLSYPNYVDYRDRNVTLAGLAAYRVEPQPMSLGGRDGAERIFGQTVSGNFFQVLGTRPAVGRFFSAEEDRPGTDRRVVVLSHTLWRRRFGADPAIVGRSLELNGRDHLVVGIAQPGFTGPTFLAPDAWVPIHAAAERTLVNERAAVWLVLVGRLKAHVTPAQAEANLVAIAAALRRTYPEANRTFGASVRIADTVPGNLGKPLAAFLALLLALVGLVLVVACVNVTGMLLARAVARRREVAIRLALGASVGRLVQQLAVESLLLFAVATAGGLLLAVWGTHLIASMLPQLPVPIAVDLGVDWRVVGFTLVVGLVAGVAAGLVPALQGGRPALVPGLKAGEGEPAAGRVRLRRALVAGQIALSLLLIVAAGLLLRSLHQAGRIDPGFDARRVDVVSLDFSLAGYDDRTGAAFAEQLVTRVSAMPGVTSAALTRVLPLLGMGFSLGGVSVPGHDAPDPRLGHEADWSIVTPGYFETLRIPIVRGRAFSDGDRRGAPRVAIVNETLARRFWPDGHAVGQRFFVPVPFSTAATEYEIVGVARDGKYRSLADSARPFVYVPFAQQYSEQMELIVRTARGTSVVGDVRRLLRSMAPGLPIVNAQPLSTYVALGLLPQRVAAGVSGGLGVVVLLLAALGLYGVTAYSVARRTREIGVRMALGAARRDVVRLVLGGSLQLAATGIAIGTALALPAAHVLGGLLYGVAPADPITFASAVLLFLGIALAASYVPLRRAMAVDPMRALRHE